MHKRLRIAAGNWKMNLSPKEALEFFKEISRELSKNPIQPGQVRVIFPPAYALGTEIQKAAESASIEIGAQNVHWEEKGAFTGEIAAPILKILGVHWVLVGHSERRQYFGETDASAAKRFARAIKSDLNVIYCIGERLEEREKGLTEEVLTRQTLAFTSVLKDELKNARSAWALAYEPVWAIGTGKTATSEQAEQAHQHIRKVIANELGAEVSNQVSILYGGSVTPENAPELLRQNNIDGVLVGGASLKPQGFAQIIRSL